MNFFDFHSFYPIKIVFYLLKLISRKSLVLIRSSQLSKGVQKTEMVHNLSCRDIDNKDLLLYLAMVTEFCKFSAFLAWN